MYVYIYSQTDLTYHICNKQYITHLNIIYTTIVLHILYHTNYILSTNLSTIYCDSPTHDHTNKSPPSIKTLVSNITSNNITDISKNFKIL